MKTYNFLQIKANVAVTCNHAHGIQTLASKSHLPTDKIKNSSTYLRDHKNVSLVAKLIFISNFLYFFFFHLLSYFTDIFFKA